MFAKTYKTSGALDNTRIRFERQKEMCVTCFLRRTYEHISDLTESRKDGVFCPTSSKRVSVYLSQIEVIEDALMEVDEIITIFEVSSTISLSLQS